MASVMSNLDRMVYSHPHRVHFAGWETTTYALQRAGWKLSAMQDPHMGRLQLAMRLESADLYMVSEVLGVNFMHFHHDYLRDRELDFVVRKVVGRDIVPVAGVDFSRYQPIDAEPVYEMRRPKSIKDFNIFAVPLARTEQIIVEPQSVQECLDLIRKMQAPELAEIRERNRRRDAMQEPAPQQVFHAQILSLAA